jgi:glycosyltransferase involved in cell wall biosynthesis
LARLGDHRHDVLIIGRGEHLALAGACGLDPLGGIPVPLSRTVLGREALLRIVSAYESALGPYDLLHAWTLSAAVLAAHAVRRRRVLAGAVIGPAAVRGPAVTMAARRLERRGVRLLAGSSTVRREYEAAGFDPALLSVLPPAVDRRAVAVEDRARLRERWGADENTFVVGLQSDPVPWADGSAAVGAVARAALTGRDIKLVVHPDAFYGRNLHQWIVGVAMRDRIVVEGDAAEPWRISAGLDAALCMTGCSTAGNGARARPRRRPARTWPAADRVAALVGLPLRGATLHRPAAGAARPLPGVLPVLWAMAAAVPVIGEATDAVRELIKDGRTGLLVGRGDANAAAKRILQLSDDPGAATRIGAAGQALVD